MLDMNFVNLYDQHVKTNKITRNNFLKDCCGGKVILFVMLVDIKSWKWLKFEEKSQYIEERKLRYLREKKMGTRKKRTEKVDNHVSMTWGDDFILLIETNFLFCSRNNWKIRNQENWESLLVFGNGSGDSKNQFF